MKYFQLFIALLISASCFSQGQANNWYFGERAGLSFASGTPVPLTNGKLNTVEGCSSFSDKDGNLLFYSDGTTVWNKNHDVMSGGSSLNGDASSTQSAMIIPKPGSANEYYIFTVGARSSDNSGFYYYTIDISLNGGLGAVVAGPVDLNQGQAAEWSEKVAAVKSSKCDAYWVVSFVSNEFVAYEITTSGVSSTPVRSLAGYIAQGTRGYLKISPDGKRLAVAHTGEGILAVFDFNNTTGVVSNSKVLPLNAPADKPYGVEFSSNGEKLYAHAYNDFFDRNNPANNDVAENHKSKLYQFDVSLPSLNEIIGSKVILDDRDLYRGALQLGPDHKIYRTLARSYFIGNSYLGVIESPNESGEAANYVHNAISLGSKKATQGLPPFISSIFSELNIRSNENLNAVITNQTINLCVGSSYTFNPEQISGSGTYSWKLGGIEIHSGESLNLNNVDFSASGEYELTIEVVDICNDVIIYQGKFLANVFDPPNITTTYSYEQCDIDDNPTDGISLFNLTSKDEEIKGTDTSFEITYYNSQTDLDNDNPIPNPTSYQASTGAKIYFKLTNPATGCFDIGELDLFSYATSLDAYDPLYACENDISTDPLFSVGSGTGSFDFEQKRQDILDLFSVTDIEVGFFATVEDAQTSLNPLEGILELSSSEIFVKISNDQSNDCISVGKFEVVLHELPIPNSYPEPVILCVDNPRGNPQTHTIPLIGTTNNSADNYQWFLNGNLISSSNVATWNANEAGVYTVEATRTFFNGDQCAAVASFEVIESNPALIHYDDLTIIDDSNNNSISIDDSDIGMGIYEFALDDPFGTYQDEPFFEGVIAGHHTIYIRDKNNCGLSSFETSILGFPKFFTPNNDGVNDTWSILGLNEDFYVTSSVKIFDRFGKVVAELDPIYETWDGIYNGQFLPSSDYWFSVELVDNLGTSRIRKGHFSLIRR